MLCFHVQVVNPDVKDDEELVGSVVLPVGELPQDQKLHQPNPIL